MKLNEVYHLIIYCLNCIRRDQNSTYKTGLNFLLHGNLHTDDNSSIFETIDFDICEAPIVNTAPVNKQLNNGSESPLIEIANSKEIDNNDSSSRKHTDNPSRQSYNKNSIINSISNVDTDDNSSMLETIDFDICEAPNWYNYIIGTSTCKRKGSNMIASLYMPIAL